MAVYEFAGAYDAAVLDTNSQLLKSQLFELVTEPGGVPATLYTNRTRSAGVAQPFLSDAEGNVHLFTDPGRYRLRQVGSPPGEQITVQPDPDETEGELEAHVIAADPHPVYLTQAEGIAAFAPVSEPDSASHVADPTDAHDASAVSFVPTGTIAATDVQAAIVEVASAAGQHEFLNVKRDFGAVGDGVTDDSAAFAAAFAAADVANGFVWVPAGIYNVGGGLAPTGSAPMFGAGVDAAILYAATQTGAVLDLSGWTSPPNFLGQPQWAGFTLRGDGSVDPTLAKKGLQLADVSSTVFERIYVENCGGEPLYLSTECDLNRFSDMVLKTPVGVLAPYWRVRGTCNGNVFERIGMRSIGVSIDPVNCLVIEDDGSGAIPVRNRFRDCWTENIHVPTSGRIILSKANQNLHDNWNHFDPLPVISATGTAYMELSPPASGDNGGNEVTGIIDGNGGGVIESGILVNQSWNAIVGRRGSGVRNVVIASGVNSTTVHFRGVVGAVVSGGGIVDNANDATSNDLRDLGIYKMHVVTNPGEPTFDNFWQNYGAGFANAGFWSDLSTVQLTGYIKNPTLGDAGLGLPAFVLPPLFRPGAIYRFAVESSAGFGSIIIEPSGNVIPAVGSSQGISLAGVVFRIDL